MGLHPSSVPSVADVGDQLERWAASGSYSTLRLILSVYIGRQVDRAPNQRDIGNDPPAEIIDTDISPLCSAVIDL